MYIVDMYSADLRDIDLSLSAGTFNSQDSVSGVSRWPSKILLTVCTRYCAYKDSTYQLSEVRTSGGPISALVIEGAISRSQSWVL